MAWIRNNLISILVFIVCVAGAVAYKTYMTGNSSDIVTTAESDVSGEQVLIALNRLRAVSFDTAIFSDPVFVSLVDFGTVIAPQPVGRPNPFAPIGGRFQSSSSAKPAIAPR